MIGIIFFILGLIVGSFLNVVVYRLKVAEGLVFGGSKCPKCKAKIRWYDNIPLLSFVLLGFKCRDCQEKISWQYPLVEFFGGVLFFLVGYYFFSLTDLSTWLATFYYLAIVSIFLVIFVYDLLYMEIPLILIWIGIGLAVVFNLLFDLNNGLFGGFLLEAKSIAGLVAAFLAWTFFFSLAYGSKEKLMGLGDSYLAILIGLVLGLSGTFYALVIGFFTGAVLGIILVFSRKKKMKSQLPLAPFLVLGSLIMIFWGDQLIAWYLGLFF